MGAFGPRVVRADPPATDDPGIAPGPHGRAEMDHGVMPVRARSLRRVAREARAHEAVRGDGIDLAALGWARVHPGAWLDRDRAWTRHRHPATLVLAYRGH